MDLIRITKPGEPVLEIHPDALDEHLRLGWKEDPDAELPAKAEVEETDAFDAMSDDDLRALIAERDGKAPHPRAGRPKLLAAARGDAAAKAEVEETDGEGEPAPAA